MDRLLAGVPHAAEVLGRHAWFDAAQAIMTTDIYVISLIILHWTVVLTIGIAAFIVMLMKGPAYVADALS